MRPFAEICSKGRTPRLSLHFRESRDEIEGLKPADVLVHAHRQHSKS